MLGKSTSNKKAAEFGDFQTPVALARQACALLERLGVKPLSVVEPTCGIGNFLSATLDRFPGFQQALGVEINSAYVARAREKIGLASGRVTFKCGSFFTTPWERLLKRLPEPILLIGNPPWVTNSRLGILGSQNLPVKKSVRNQTGFEALTGKANFDISQCMLVHLLEWMQGKDAVLAMLCKTAVARKTLFHAWKAGIGLRDASLFLIDAEDHFDAEVDACFFVCRSGGSSGNCRVYRGLDETAPSHVFGFKDQQIVADVDAYDACRGLQGVEHYRWRSGIKHDCSSVMELRPIGGSFENALGESVQLEPDYLYPMLKSSDLANGRSTARVMLVPQKVIGGDTSPIERTCPKTWAYLQKHGRLLDRRASRIYQDRPRFSVFGVGDYSFSPWKVAISGLYKSLKFRVVGPIAGRPTVLDDTSNFIACKSRQEAVHFAELLNSPLAAQFFAAFIFWDAKRPITIEILRKLDLQNLAAAAKRITQTLPTSSLL